VRIYSAMVQRVELPLGGIKAQQERIPARESQLQVCYRRVVRDPRGHLGHGPQPGCPAGECPRPGTDITHSAWARSQRLSRVSRTPGVHDRGSFVREEANRDAAAQGAGYTADVEFDVLVRLLSATDDGVGQRAQIGLSEVARRNRRDRDEAIGLLPTMPPRAQTRALWALSPVRDDEDEFARVAAECVGSTDGDVAQAAMLAARAAIATYPGLRHAVIARLADPDAKIVVAAVQCLAGAGHLSEVREVVGPLVTHSSAPVQSAVAEVLFSSDTLDRMAAGDRVTPAEATALVLYVIPDAEQRGVALGLIGEAQELVTSLPEFCSPEQVEKVEKLLKQDILPALAKLLDLLHEPAPDQGLLGRVRSEAREVSARVGALIRGVAVGIGSNATTVASLIVIGQAIGDVARQIPH
jgi:hypothetical protein